MTTKVKAAIIGSGNIGTDLMMKIMRHGRRVEMGAMVRAIALKRKSFQWLSRWGVTGAVTIHCDTPSTSSRY